MKKFLVLLLIALVFSPMVYAELTTDAVTSEVAAPEKKYFCAMDGFESDQPGRCELCGMDLVERPEIPAETDEALVPEADSTM